MNLKHESSELAFIKLANGHVKVMISKRDKSVPGRALWKDYAFQLSPTEIKEFKKAVQKL